MQALHKKDKIKSTFFEALGFHIVDYGDYFFFNQLFGLIYMHFD